MMRANRNHVSPRTCLPSPKSIPRMSSPYRFSTAQRKKAAPYPTEATIPIRPTMLNQPVIQLQPLPPRSWAHQEGPPAVGYLEVSSAIEKATISTKAHRIGHPIEAAIGPPFCHAKAQLVNDPARTEMIVKEIAKFVNALQPRLSSCL